MANMTVSEIIEALSPVARRVLERSSDRIGGVIALAESGTVGSELYALGVIGSNDGLTIKGSAVVCRVKPDLDF